MPRKTADRDLAAALDKGLRDMFRALETRPVPDRVRSITDQLDEPEIEPLKKRG